MPDETAAAPGWPYDIYRAFKAQGITQVCYVPDAGHRQLIDLCHADPDLRTVVLTTEEEGVAMLAGAWLGGARGALLMQSSGVGNCVNMLGMIQECRFPLLALVTMRGEWGEFNPWQVPMGEGTAAALASVGVLVRRVEEPATVEPTISAAARLAFSTGRSIAVLIGQCLVGSKAWSR